MNCSIWKVLLNVSTIIGNVLRIIYIYLSRALYNVLAKKPLARLEVDEDLLQAVSINATYIPPEEEIVPLNSKKTFKEYFKSSTQNVSTVKKKYNLYISQDEEHMRLAKILNKLCGKSTYEVFSLNFYDDVWE